MNVRVLFFIIFFFAVLVAVPLCLGAKSKPDTAVIGGIYTGEDTAKVPQKPRVKRDYVVKRSFKQKVGNRSVTVQEVEPPAEDPPTKKNLLQDTQPSRRSTPAYSKRLETNIPPKLIVVNATVYGKGKNARSKITLWHDNKKCVALSRVDFRLMSGFTQFRANGRPYFLIENIVDADTSKNKNAAGAFPKNRRMLARGFIVTDIEEGDTQSRRILRDLHKLYRVEQHKLRAAYQKRKQNGAQLKSSEPDKPVTIRFWKRDMSKEKKERGAK